MITLKSANRFSWAPDGVDGFEVREVLVGPSSGGVSGFEVVVCTSSKPVTRGMLHAVHRARVGKRIADVVIACETPSGVWVFGPDTGRAPIQLSPATATQQLQAALNEPDSVASYRRLVGIQDAQQTTEMPGVRNRGLFASYHLRENVPARKDWEAFKTRADALVPLRHRDLITQLGYQLSDGPSHTLVLSSAGSAPRAVALLLEQDEQFEATANRFQRSPVAVGLSAATQQGVPWLILVRSDQIRLYPARDNVGVGQKGQVETYLELDLAALSEEHAGLLPLVFSAESLAEGGVIDDLLEQSARFATELGVRLRTRVYESFVPNIATEVAHAVRKSARALDREGLTFAYQVTLNILFRLLFQAYGEDRGLLPAGRNEAYDANSLKTLGKRLLDQPELELGQASSIWRDLRQVWDSIDKGNAQFELPAYNGGLFASDPERHPEGAFIDQLIISDVVMGPALAALLIDDTEDGVQGLVDFRSLSVREFGTIYEGLLESSLSVADQDLVLDANGAFVPAGDSDTVTVRAGEPFFHNSSGERKSTGSYFTPSFIVDHLVERTIDPTLDKHLDRIRQFVEQGKTHEATRDFFDYRVADLAMGSGHFLVATIDRIEAKMRDFLADPEVSIPGVTSELERLAQAAKNALGRDEAAFDDIEQATLLRRQIARRCVYGLDINPLAVELSRLALWIHTFVPGLPMSTLDHNLVCANSLTGIGTIDEAESALESQDTEGMLSTFSGIVESALSEATELLTEWSHAAEATKAEIDQARELAEKSQRRSEPVRGMLDVASAVIAGVVKKDEIVQPDDLATLAQDERVRDFVAKTEPAHMPYLFPEVFTRDKAGFDAILGNPPWETLSPDKRKFWAVRFPGLFSRPVKERGKLIEGYEQERPDLVAEFEAAKEAMQVQRRVLQKRFSLGAGDTDLSEAFAWTFFALIRREGRLGIVMPKTAFSSQGLAEWRRHVLSIGSISSLVTAVNSGRWLFDIDPRYSVAFAVITKGVGSTTTIAGPFFSREEFDAGSNGGAVWENETLLSLTESSAFPNVGRQKDADIVATLRKSPKLVDWEALEIRAVAELHSTNDRHHFDHPKPVRPVTVLSGRGFNIWKSFTGKVFATAEYHIVRDELMRRLDNQVKLKKSAFHGLSWPEDFGGKLPFERSRIALRGMANPTDTRTTIPALVPPLRILPHTAPYLFLRYPAPRKEAFLLAVLSSISLDWYSRKFIQTSLMNHLLNAFPIPSASEDELADRIIELSGRLAAENDEFSDWAEQVGVPVGSLSDPVARDEAIAELDGLVAVSYGLSRDQLEHIFATFHRGWDPGVRAERALTAFDEWSVRS